MSNPGLAALRLSLLPGRYAICRLPASAPAPEVLGAPLSADGGLVSVTRTADELSLVCPEAMAPVGARCETGWRCLRVEGPLDLGLTGILAGLTAPLAGAGIPVFALSTYDTDHLLVRESDVEAADAALEAAGFGVSGPGASLIKGAAD